MTETKAEYQVGDKQPLGTNLRGWSADTEVDDALAEFVAHLGYKPDWIIRTGGAVLAGPVREGKDG